MAKGETEKLIISVTPDAINSKGEVRRNSTGKLSIKPSLSLSSSDDKLVPHYLRAFSPSCHDYCKYGHKHVFEAKKRQPSFRRFSDNKDIQHEEENSAEVSILRARWKRPEPKVKTTHPKDELSHKIKKTQNDIHLSDTIRNLEEESYEESDRINLLTPSSDGGEDLPDAFKNIDAESENIKPTSPSPFYESIASPDRKSIPSTKLTPLSRAKKSKSLEMGEGKKRDVVKMKTAPKAKIETMQLNKIVTNKAEAIKEKNVEVTGRLNVINKRNPIEETRMSVKLKMTEVKIPSSVEERGVFKRKVESPFKRMDVTARSSIPLKMKTPMVKSTSPLVSSARLSSQTKQGNRTIAIRNRDLPKLGEEEVLKPSRASMSPKTTGDGVSSMSCEKVDKFERTSAILKTKKKKSHSLSNTLSSSSSSSSVQKHYEDNESGATELLFSDEEEKRNKPVQSQKDVGKQRSVRIASNQTDDKPHKLNFRRGKILSPKSESSGPRKLRFRQARVANDSGKEVRILSSRKKRGSGGSVAELTTSNQGAPHVVLRHQGLQEKKEDQDSCNHVIEETANKLNFRRGKTVIPKSEIKGPRKLRLNSGKEVGKRSFRMRRGSGGSVTELITHIPEARPVVLRHQGVQEKKEAQGLLNHVIEETAKKLVEARKSKVEALVGAFETVIFLQESRVTPTV